MSVVLGDCVEVMRGMDECSVDAVCCDPPYLIDFMGKSFDRQHHMRDGANRGQKMQAWHQDWAVQALRVLKPSCYLLAFGGTRTSHRLTCAIEDAGFEIRDCLMWLYGSGFPKGKASLKPAWEPVILARKPGPMRELGIEECRVGTSDNLNGGAYAKNGNRVDLPGAERSVKAAGMMAAGKTVGADFAPPSGRWPANLVLECTCDETREGTAKTGTHVGHNRDGTAVASRIAGLGRKDTRDIGYSGPHGKEPVRIHTNPNCPCAMLDGQTAGLAKAWSAPSTGAGREADRTHSTGIGELPGDAPFTYGDSGGASRFFYAPKASRAERGEGNTHPTVKNLALMRWLVRLVARPGDVVLDPFMGSGTTGVACAMEGREFIGVEREAEYIEIAQRRIEAASAQTRMEMPA